MFLRVWIQKTYKFFRIYLRKSNGNSILSIFMHFCSLGRTDVQDNWVIIDDTDPNNKVKFYINVCRSLNEVKVGTGCSPFAAVCATKITNGVVSSLIKENFY